MQNNNQPAAANPQPESLEDSLEPQAPAAQKSAAAASPPPKPPAGKRFSLFGNLYLLVFVLLVFAAAGVVYVAMKSSKPSSNQTKTTSLTDQQISSLKGNTTLVGDSKQTLDIQSNSIFEGQVLDRGDLNVAGSLKVGGPLSLPSVSVGGNGTFGQIGISGGLNVAGDSTLQGALTVQKNLTVSGSGSFGSCAVISTLTSISLPAAHSRGAASGRLWAAAGRLLSAVRTRPEPFRLIPAAVLRPAVSSLLILLRTSARHLMW
jgi:cytoskeletal protein CcmA (bactofilin family)